MRGGSGLEFADDQPIGKNCSDQDEGAERKSRGIGTRAGNEKSGGERCDDAGDVRDEVLAARPGADLAFGRAGLRENEIAADAQTDERTPGDEPDRAD